MKTPLYLILALSAFNSYAQQTYVPDDNFETYLEANSMGNGILNDDYVTTANISGVTVLSVNNLAISDLTGIEDFISLTDLNVQDNLLMSIDVSQNTALTSLNCSNNQLTTIDISQNTALIAFLCNNTQLTSLDVSFNTALLSLYCNNNQLTSLDVSQNTGLLALYCENNQLTTLDVSLCTSLVELFCANNQLLCFFGNNGGTYTLFCDNNQLYCANVFDPQWFFANAIYDTGTQFSYNICTDVIDNDVNQFGTQLTAEQNGAIYQWLDCDNNYAVISGETNQVFTATASGNYAVEITTQGCVPVIDTSTCVHVDCQSVIDNDINQNGALLIAEQNGASYQWLDCSANYAIISGETNQSFTATGAGYFAVEITITDACGGLQVDTSSCHQVQFADLDELTLGTQELVKIVDLMGRETTYAPNRVLIYIYSDGTTKRVFSLED